MDRKEVTRAEFDAAAEHYDGDTTPHYMACRRNYRELTELLTKLHPGAVLDAGCGTGAFLEMLAKALPDARLTGLDLSENMLSKAREKRIPNAEFLCGDCEKLELGDETFDAVTCSMSFHHYPEPELFLKNALRVLKPGGTLVISDPTADRIKLFFYELSGYYRYQNRRKGNGVVRLYSPERLSQMMRRAGFKILSAERLDENRVRVMGRKGLL